MELMGKMSFRRGKWKKKSGVWMNVKYKKKEKKIWKYKKNKRKVQMDHYGEMGIKFIIMPFVCLLCLFSAGSFFVLFVGLFVDAAAAAASGFFLLCCFDGCLLMVSGSNSSIRNTVGKLMFQNIVFCIFFVVCLLFVFFRLCLVSVASSLALISTAL
jgi:hypothetical protein